MMKIYFFIISLCLFIAPLAKISQADTYSLVTLEYPPLQYSENGETVGIAADIVREAFARMGHDVEIEISSWARAISMVKEGQADAIFTAFKNAERETYLDYSKEVLIPQNVSLFALKSSNITYDGDLSKLTHKSFGVRYKLSYGAKFDAAVSNGIINFVNVSDTQETNVRKLLMGRIDVMVGNRLGSLYLINQMNSRNKVIELAPVIQSIPSYIAFSKERQLSGLRDEYDIVFKQMEEEGIIDIILNSLYTLN